MATSFPAFSPPILGGLAMLLLGAVLLAALGAQQFRIDASSDSLVVETDPALATWRAMNDRYGSGEFLVVTFEPDAPLFEARALRTLGALVESLRAVDGVEAVQSLLDVPLLKSPPVPLDTLSDGVRTLRDPSTDRALAQKELLESPLFRNLLLSPDGQTTALQVTLSPDNTYEALLAERQRWLLEAQNRSLTPEEERTRGAAVAALEAYKPQAAARQAVLVAAVRDIVAEYRNGATVHLAGVPMIADDMLRFVRNDLERFSLGVLGLLVATLATSSDPRAGGPTPRQCGPYHGTHGGASRGRGLAHHGDFLELRLAPDHHQHQPRDPPHRPLPRAGDGRAYAIGPGAP